MTVALGMMFPGQGSQSVGMLAELAAAHAVVRETFDEASQAVERDLWALAQDGPAEELDRTVNTQPVL
ncbi:MAG: malonyl CoA-acyl carrier protein transacylase, partial [Pseudomonadales bacterium]|nr:malonyl CoA-acyl carrier protein transacylase [Pseudomonadales bacterium]MEE4383171.1 malonyl CoA-acyl carrier protein transacylase [Pseudomonadales bacterium]